MIGNDRGRPDTGDDGLIAVGDSRRPRPSRIQRCDRARLARTGTHGVAARVAIGRRTPTVGAGAKPASPHRQRPRLRLANSQPVINC